MNHSRTSQRPAFTLLEIIIATSLTTAILLILWSLFGIYTKLEEQGSETTTEIQLVRGLYRQLQSDLGRLTSSPAPMPTRLSTVTSQQQPRDPGPTMESQERLTFPAGTQLVGSQSRLELTLASQPSDHALYIRPVSSVPATVFTIIQYEWTGQEEIPETPQVRMQPGDRLGEGPVAEPSTGLRRTMVPWLFAREDTDDPAAEITTPREQRPTATVPSETSPPGHEDLIPEVSAWQLQYFDGINWLPQWNSSSLGRLPVAIKISFNLEPPVTLDALPESDANRDDNRETTPPSRDAPDTTMEPPPVLRDPSLDPYVENPFEYQFVIAINTPGFSPPDPTEEP